MGLRTELKNKALGASQKALEQLLRDERRAEKVAEVVGAVQGARAKVKASQEAVLGSLSLATRHDFKALGKSVAGLTRRVQALGKKLDAASGDPREARR